MGKEFSHYEETPSTWTFAKDDLPVQLKATTEATGINWDYLPWFWWLRDYDAKVVFTLRTGAVEVFGH